MNVLLISEIVKSLLKVLFKSFKKPTRTKTQINQAKIYKKGTENDNSTRLRACSKSKMAASYHYTDFTTYKLEDYEE